MIKIGSSQSAANVVLSQDKAINDLQIGIQIRESTFIPDGSDLLIADLSTNNHSKITLKAGQKFSLHDDSVVSFGGIAKYSIKYNADKSLMTCVLDPNFEDPHLKTNPPPN